MDTIAVAHNMKAYDGVFVYDYLLKNGYDVEVILNGSKFMRIRVKNCRITFLDSCNFLPMRLKEFSNTFDLRVKKGYFPYLFNTLENKRYNGPIPELSYFDPDGLSTGERAELVTWHEAKTLSGEAYSMETEIAIYCQDDVRLMKEGCLRFRAMILENTNGLVDPFNHVTIASTCMAIYKTVHLREYFEEDGEERTVRGRLTKEEREGLVFQSTDFARVTLPIYGGCADTFSLEAIRWLETRAYFDDVRIQHALNGGEYKVPETPYFVDGYDSRSRTIYSYHGCIFHGCTMCFPDRFRTTGIGGVPHVVYERTMKRQKRFESLGYRVITAWGHEMNDLPKDEKIYFDNVDVQPRLLPSKAFFGGRTNCVKLYSRVEADQRIEYVDFTSLYPWVNKYSTYPKGHPEIILSDFDHTLESYFGLASIKILPPRGLYHPVLPLLVRSGRLAFTLCARCADQQLQERCSCTTDQRALTGVWCTPEIQKAREMGYVVLKIYEVYHWNEVCSGEDSLFASYVDGWLKVKQESSGYPSDLTTDEERLHYRQLYEETEGLRLDPEKMRRNPGLRKTAKLCLNR